MKTITAADVQEERLHHFVAEASALGFAPGRWPDSIRTDLGNGFPFDRISHNSVGDELISVEYRQACGCISLTVLND